jgi:hypothetical protein
MVAKSNIPKIPKIEKMPISCKIALATVRILSFLNQITHH